jgi:hypothetical protein
MLRSSESMEIDFGCGVSSKPWSEEGGRLGMACITTAVDIPGQVSSLDNNMPPLILELPLALDGACVSDYGFVKHCRKILRR